MFPVWETGKHCGTCVGHECFWKMLPLLTTTTLTFHNTGKAFVARPFSWRLLKLIGLSSVPGSRVTLPETFRLKRRATLISFPDLLWTKPKARSGKVRKFVSFYWLLHLTPVLSLLWKLTRFSAANFLRTQVLTWKFPRLVKMKADKKRREEERFGSNLPFGIEQLLQHDRTVT